jgi:hypothetical protein
MDQSLSPSVSELPVPPDASLLLNADSARVMQPRFRKGVDAQIDQSLLAGDGREWVAATGQIGRL